MPEKIKNTQVSVAGHIEPQINRYYLKVARRYLVVGIVFMLILLVYIAGVTVFLGDYVTYDNLKYLARDFDAMTITGNAEFKKIVYNGSDDMAFAYFRNGLAVCDSDSYTYFDTSGGVLVNDQISYGDPVLSPSEKYLMLYDVGGRKYSVYNQLTGIISRETDGDIIAGDVADDGSFIITSRSRETRYVVEMYNASFTKVMNIYKENYVFDSAISPNGKLAVICSAIPAETDFNCEVEICRRGEADPISIKTYENTMPLDLYSLDNGFVLLCDNGLYFIGYDGVIVDGISFSGMRLKYADINDTTAVVVCSTNALGNENRVIVFDSSDGSIIYDEIQSYRIMGAFASTNLKNAKAYFTTPQSVIRINSDGELDVHTPDGRVKSVIPMHKGALVCGESSAYPIFED